MRLEIYIINLFLFIFLINHYIEDKKLVSIKVIIYWYQVYNPPSKPNLVTWLGGAIFGATDVVVTRSLTREQYLKDPSVPDWSDLR